MYSQSDLKLLLTNPFRAKNKKKSYFSKFRFSLALLRNNYFYQRHLQPKLVK